MEIVWFIAWSVAPADCLVCGGMLALSREGIVVAIKLFTIDIVIVLCCFECRTWVHCYHEGSFEQGPERKGNFVGRLEQL